MLAMKFGNQRWNGLEDMWVRDDDDDDDANFVHDPNIHLGRVHSVADKALLARQWKERMEALVDHHQFGGRINNYGRSSDGSKDIIDRGRHISMPIFINKNGSATWKAPFHSNFNSLQL